MTYQHHPQQNKRNCKLEMFAASPSNKAEKAPSGTSRDGDRDVVTKEEIMAELTGYLTAVGQARDQGKSIDSLEVSEPLRELSNGIGNIMLTDLSLSDKFQFGDQVCDKVLMKGTLVDDLIDYCLKERKKLPKIPDTVDIIWTFFLNGTNFSTDLSKKLSKCKEILVYGKDVLEAIYEPYVKKKSPKYGSFLDTISATTHNMCTFCEATITDVRAAGYLPVYLKYLESEAVKCDHIVRTPVLAAASDIMNEHDASMAATREDVGYIVGGMEKALQSPSGQFNGWFIFELAKIIGNLAIFDSNKKLLVEYGVLSTLNKVAKQSNEIEQITAVRTLAQLAFDDDNKMTLIIDTQTDVVSTLFDLAKSSPYQSVREAAKGVLWTLSEQLHSSSKYADLVQDLFGKKAKGHVMISYSREQRPLLLRIKGELENAGFSVWMDIEQMRENVYDRMAEAIQDAAVVLISMSYSYQRSEYCRREAAYASSLKRARIPLLVDSGYTSEGWLALMTAGDYHYDFVRKPFDTKVTELIKELERRCQKSPKDMTDGITKEVVSQQSSQASSSHGLPSYSSVTEKGDTSSSTQEPAKGVSKQDEKTAKRWKKFSKLNKEQFVAWLDKQKLPRELFESYRAKDIVFLAQMKNESPDTYYKHVMKLSRTKNKMESLQLAADFTRSLEHLKPPDQKS